MKNIILFFLTIGIFPSIAQDQTPPTPYDPKPFDKKYKTAIMFDNDWSAALDAIQKTSTQAYSKSNRKFAFLLVCAEWNRPTNAMFMETFSNRELGDFFNKNFVNLRAMEGPTPGTMAGNPWDTLKLGEEWKVFPITNFLRQQRSRD